MKYLLLLILSTMFCSVFSQDRPYDAYAIEESGYYINPQYADGNVILTDNYSNTLYKLKNGEITSLISAPGCGRYFTISSDGNKIGFKLIQDGYQIPAVFDLVNNKVEKLAEPSLLCGQVYFDSNNNIIYALGNKIYIRSSAELKVFDIGIYSNLTPVSPDGNYIAYNMNDEVHLLDTKTGETEIVSAKGLMSVYPQFSPDSKSILYQSGGKILVYDINTNSTTDLGEGIGPKWSPNSDKIVYYKTQVENYKVIKSELFMRSINAEEPVQLTFTEDVKEMQPSFIHNNVILYHTYNDNAVLVSVIDDGHLVNTVEQYDGSLRPDIQFYNNAVSSKSEVRIPGTVPYTHQVYDTPDWHYGYGSCAPTCAIMAISYYNLLPKWPITCSSPYSHTSDYGSYVADKYTIDEFYYDVVEPTSGGDDAWGGYGYMWGMGSPNSYMGAYISGHYLTSSQLWTSSCTFTNTTNEIDNGYPHPMCAMLSSAGHLVLAKGYIVGQHTLIFSEPYGDKNTTGWPSYDGQNAYYDWPGYNNGYENLDYNGSYGYIAWTVTAQGTEVTYNDTIIDDVYYNHGFNVNNSANGSHMRYFHDLNTGYNNHMWYTITMASLSDICWVTWEPELAQSGRYEVEAYIPALGADAVGAIYKVHHANGDSTVVMDQSVYNDQWVSLGIFDFDTSMVSYVYLGDSTGIDGDTIAFDAVKWTYLPVPSINYSLSSNSLCAGESVQINNNTTDATSYEWIFEGGTPQTSTDVNPVVVYDTAGTFDVSLIAYGIGGNDTLTMNDYITVYALPVAGFEANDTSIYLPNAIATFNNYSVNADGYFWDFGNGQTSTDLNPYCIYMTQGDYTITLIAENSNCADDTLTFLNYIHVLLNTHAETVIKEQGMVFPNPFSDNISVMISDIEEVRFISLSGQTLKTVHAGFENIDCRNLEQGIYLLQLIRTDQSVIYLKVIRE